MKDIGQKVRPTNRLKSNPLAAMLIRVRARFLNLTLFQQFAIACTLVLGLTMTVLGSWISNRIAAGVLHRSAEVGALYMEHILGPHVQALASGKSLSAEDIATLDLVTASFALKRHVLSIKVWLPDGTVAYSSQKDIIGRKFETDEIAPAMNNVINGYLSELEDDENDFERTLKVPLYEIYAPIYKTGTNQIIAVGEFYENAEDLSSELYSAVADNWLVVGTSGILMMLILFGIVYRGSAQIERQHAKLRQRFREQIRLHRSNERLQLKVQDALRETARMDHQIQRRVGAELHDGPAQHIAFVLLMLDEIEKSVGSGAGARASSPEVLDMIRKAATEALAEIRSISTGLFLPIVDSDGNLLETVQSIIQSHERRTGSVVLFSSIGTPHKGSPEITQSVGRVTQEALNNAWKYAPNSRREVELVFSESRVVLSIMDNGPGMNLDENRIGDEAHLGLQGIKYRIESVGGIVNIRSAAGVGTEILCEIPF